MKKKKGVVQPDVDLEVDSPAHSFLRLVTPVKLHSPTAGTSSFGKITRRGKPSAFSDNIGGILPSSLGFSLRDFCNSNVKLFHFSYINLLRDALLFFDKQVFNFRLEFMFGLRFRSIILPRNSRVRTRSPATNKTMSR